MASQESEDTCEMRGWGEWVRWGHKCGFLYSWIELDVTKGVGLALVVEEKRKEKREKKKKKEKGNGLGWVGCGARCQ